jgi:iron complex transport system substrate-binding protein
VCYTATWAQTTIIDADQQAIVIKESSRLVTVGGAITEIVYALGAGAKLVGVDTSSTYPEAATTLPRVGYQRLLSAEGVLSLNPFLILVSAEAGPPAAISQLRATGAAVLKVPVAYTVDGVQAKIRMVAQALDLERRGEELVQLLMQDIAEAKVMLHRIRSQPRVLFIYARSSGALQVSGFGTAADAMIRLAGGVNAVTGYEGYRPLTAEAVVAAAPDVILLPMRSLEILGGLDGLLTAPGLALTPAGEKRRIVAMDDLYLLGFGPRTGQAVRELASRLHPELSGNIR